MVRTTKYPYIVKEETSQGERAVVDGTSVAVSDIASDYYTRHLLIDKIVYTRGLTPAQVFCALAYHHDHKAELARFQRDSSVETLCNKADEAGIGESFRALVAVGKRHFWSQAYIYNIRFAPPIKDRRVALFTVQVRPVQDSRVEVWVSPDQFPRFYPAVTSEEVTKLIGSGTQYMTRSDVETFVKGVDELVARNN